MITIAGLFVFISFYMFYYTSRKALLSYDYGFEKWMNNNPGPTKISGLAVLLLAYSLLLFTKALGTGTLLFFIQLMTIGSLIVILSPLKVINSKAVAILFIVSALIEIYYY